MKIYILKHPEKVFC